VGKLHFAILGPVEVTIDGVPVHVGGPREQKALAALLLATPRVVGVQRLTQILWDGESPITAKAQVHNTIARLRRNLAAAGADHDVISSSGPGYVIRIADDQCDAAIFEARDGAGSALTGRGELAAAADTLRGALDRWRGPALDGMVCQGLAGEAQRLNEQRLACLERRIEVDLALGRHADLTGELAALVAEHPLRERLVEHQMVALYRCGRRLEALEAFNASRVRLAEQTGQSSGATSYHLRQLAAYGFVEEDETRRAGRERWWRPVHRAMRLDADDAREAPAEAEAYLRAVAAQYADRVDRWLTEVHTMSRAWDEAATLSDYRLRLRADEAARLLAELEAVIAPYRRDEPDVAAPDDAERVVLQVQLLPFIRNTQ